MEPTNRDRSLEEALSRTLKELGSLDIQRQCHLLGLHYYENRECLVLPAFESDVEIRLPGYDVVDVLGGGQVPVVDRILVLRYLLAGAVYEPGELVSFQDLPGGMFYLEPFRKRTVDQLVHRFGNDTDLLLERLDRFRWEPLPLGDVGASIQVLDRIHLVLVYRIGDHEFPPTADILFYSGMKTVFTTDEATALAARTCRGLIAS